MERQHKAGDRGFAIAILIALIVLGAVQAAQGQTIQTFQCPSGFAEEAAVVGVPPILLASLKTVVNPVLPKDPVTGAFILRDDLAAYIGNPANPAGQAEACPYLIDARICFASGSSGASGFDPRLVEWLADRIAAGVLEAFAALAPAALAAGEVPIPGVSWNRSAEDRRIDPAEVVGRNDEPAFLRHPLPSVHAQSRRDGDCTSDRRSPERPRDIRAIHRRTSASSAIRSTTSSTERRVVSSSTASSAGRVFTASCSSRRRRSSASVSADTPGRS